MARLAGKSHWQKLSICYKIVAFLTTNDKRLCLTMKSTLLFHKGYYGSIEPSLSEGVLRGRALFINQDVTYEALTVSDLQPAFEAAIVNYLKSCEADKRAPERPFRGQFNVRVAPNLHKSAALRARQEKTSLNTIVVNALQHYLSTNHNEVAAQGR
jgi:predicted HicB family RNase H-like nuclease